MDRAQFETLRDLPDKVIYEEIVFAANKNAAPTVLFGPVPVYNSLNIEVMLHAHFNPNIPSLTFNFSVKDAGGPICRVDVNGNIHGNAGRTHKHELMTPDCPRLNLPTANARGDFDLTTMTPHEVWNIVCAEANITHRAGFQNP